MKLEWSLIRIPLIAALAMAGGGEYLHVIGFRINITPSEPIGLWRVDAGRKPAIGEYVYFCPPVSRARYPFLFKGSCPGGSMPFLKKIVAGPGMRIRETGEGVWINHHRLANSRPIPRSLGGDPVSLPRWRGSIRLKPGQYWVYGSGDPTLSFDSRYWGPLAGSNIMGIAKPVWVLPGIGKHNDHHTITAHNQQKEIGHHES